MAKQAKFFSYFTKLKVTQTLVEKTLGMTDLPLLSEPNLQQQLVEIHYQGKSLEEAGAIKNSQIAEELELPPVKVHCSILAEDAIKAAIADYKAKKGS